MQNKMQRRLGQLTGTCFQRCVGMDAINALHSVTFDLDRKHGTGYHDRFKNFLAGVQRRNFVVGGAMTDVKGDRSKAPSEQADPDLFVHVARRTEEGVYITGAKAHQTGCLNSHWLIVMPTMRLGPADKEYAIAGALPVDAEGITYIYGRQSCDTRERIFMDGEVESAAALVERFTCYHRRSYVCKTGVGDVLIGAAATIADYNGVERVSHVRDKLVEMTHLNETIYGAGIAASYQGMPMESGVYLPDEMLANVCKHHVTRFPYEIGRLAQDLAGGLMVTLPSEAELRHETIGPIIEKYLKGRADIPTEDRIRILRLIENMTLGRNAVGYLTESMHGAGSPQAQRIQIARAMQIEFKKDLAKALAGIGDSRKEEIAEDLSTYMARVFAPTPKSPA
jgi:4-hydroxybutyryl-CoA dehydratase/vinylacetyl-CoA-Delta-isomerase